MIKGWDLTIYELLGYLLPGMVAFAAIWIGVSAYYNAWLCFPTFVRMGWMGRSIAFLVPSYFLGHATHGIANRIGTGKLEKSAAATVMSCVPEEAIRAVCKAMGIHDEGEWTTRAIQKKPKPFIGVCSEIVEQVGKIGAREVFTYREGFYRGTTVSLILFAGGLAALATSGGVTPVSRLHALAGLITTLLVALIFVDRYARFARYRMAACVNGAIVLIATAKKTEDSKSGKDPEST